MARSMLVLNTLSLIGAGLVFAGIASLFAERTFYDYVDESGVLQESFFLPLGFILIFIGMLFGMSSVICGLFRVFGRRARETKALNVRLRRAIA